MEGYPYTTPDRGQMTLPCWKADHFYQYDNGGWYLVTYDHGTSLFTVLRPVGEQERNQQMLDRLRAACLGGSYV